MTACRRDISRRLAALAVATALVVAGTPAARATTGTVVADSGSGNGMAAGAVVRTDPDNALVTVTNGFHFWAALDVSYVPGSNVLRPAPLSEDFGGIYAAGGLIGPNSTAASDGHFGSATQALVRIHYDLSSAGGAAALAANLLTIIADSLGASLSTTSSSRLLAALQLVTGMSSWADLVHQAQNNDIWGLVTSIEVLLGSKTGRDTIRQALADLNVLASDADLIEVVSVVGIIDWVYTLFDVYRAALLGQNDGTVIFSVAPPSVAAAHSPAATVRQYEGRFVVTGSMSNAHYGASPVPLADGRVLVAGGAGNNGALTTAELYDPRTGTWSPTGSMMGARTDATVAKLANGRILCAGGLDGTTVLATAELYDPRTGTWSPTGSMVGPRRLAAVATLADGRVLVAGGAGASNTILATAELYDPRTGTWLPTGSMAAARFEAAFATLADGRVLVAGGWDGNAHLATAELYDPRTGTWSQTGSLSVARAYAAFATLAHGRVLVAGGYDNAALATAELYDPRTGTWSPTGSMAAARGNAAIATLADGRVLVAGGLNANTPLAIAELYDPRTGTWLPTGSMAGPRAGAAVTLADGRVLVAGGGGVGFALSTAEIFQ